MITTTSMTIHFQWVENLCIAHISKSDVGWESLMEESEDTYQGLLSLASAFVTPAELLPAPWAVAAAVCVGLFWT